MDLSQLESEALQLEPEARTQLVERLLESLDLGSADLDQQWIEEAIARDEEIAMSVVQARPAEQFHREARRRLG